MHFPFASLRKISLSLIVAGAALAVIATRVAHAEALLVVEADTGKVLQAENATYPWYPASVTKMMTAYVVLKAVKEGRLAPPKTTPNCVSSQADSADAEHYIAPIPFKGDALAAMAAVRKAVESMHDSTVIRAERDYLYAEYRTRIMRFVDDVEFAFDEKAALIHVRSASRLGRRDFGVNRARVEEIRARIEGRLKT